METLFCRCRFRFCPPILSATRQLTSAPSKLRGIQSFLFGLQPLPVPVHEFHATIFFAEIDLNFRQNKNSPCTMALWRQSRINQLKSEQESGIRNQERHFYRGSLGQGDFGARLSLLRRNSRSGWIYGWFWCAGTTGVLNDCPCMLP